MSYSGYGMNSTVQPPLPTMSGQGTTGQSNMQFLFPQPQGNVYNINSTLEVASVPIGAGISIALCLPEKVMYIKTMKNGNKIVPFNQNTDIPTEEKPVNEKVNSTTISMDQLIEQVKNCNNRISDLEERFSNTNQRKKEFDI